MARFDANPRLGIGGGVLVEPADDGGLRRIAIAPLHVHGALKCYSRDCFEAIGGIQERLGWDTIDATYARMRGFETVHFPEIVSMHHGRSAAPTAPFAATLDTASAPTSPTNRRRG